MTFDVENFISGNSIAALRMVLEVLMRYDLKALFFVTGHMAEKLQSFPMITDLLNENQIGYHSSGHSVHPTVFEFTDTASYEEAYLASMKIETSHINPLTGEVEGRGGILLVRDLFPTKQIVAYRAPGCCWSPPHTEALRDLGIKFDFSSNFSPKPVYYKGLTFYPHPIIARWQAKFSDYRIFGLSVLRNQVTAIGLHPSLFVNKDEWDSIYWNKNPKNLTPPCPRETDEIKSLFHSFDMFLNQIKWLEKMRLIEVVSSPRKSETDLTVTKNNVEKCYETSIAWAKKFFNYEPKFLRRHFFKFFDLPYSNSENKTYINQ